MKSKLFFFLFCLPLSLLGQELNCVVKLDYSQIQAVNPTIYAQIEQNLTLFMNETLWTKDEFAIEERIHCYFNIDITQQSGLNSFSATASISALRPIYGTDYESSTIVIFDKEFNFIYNEGDDIIFNESGFNTNLVSMLSFYAYYIIGLDYDSFSLLGGSEHFEKSRNILNIAQNLSAPGWSQDEGTNNRYWLLDNMLNPQFETFRSGTYRYYRLAFDKFTEDPVAAQNLILETIEDIRAIRELAPASYLIKTYFQARQKELISIFKGAEPAMQNKAMNLLIAADPTHQNDYRSIILR